MSFLEILAGESSEGRDYELLRIELGERVITRLLMEDMGMVALDDEDFMSWQTYRQLFEDDVYNTELPEEM